MESVPVDIDAGQIVRWVMAEQAAVPLTFKTVARLTTEVREIPLQRKFHLGDEERQELSEVATIGSLEIAPAHPSEGWLLTVTVEDEIGPRVAAEAAPPETEREIDLGTFYSTFIRPDRGVASVVAEVEGPSARLHVARLLEMIERNRHAAPPPKKGS